MRVSRFSDALYLFPQIPNFVANSRMASLVLALVYAKGPDFRVAHL
jgi:hypothetical protein